MADESQGNGAPEAPQGKSAPEGSDDKKQTPPGMSSEEVNRAITARFKDFEKKFSGQFDAFTKALDERIPKPKAEPPKDDPGDEDDKPEKPEKPKVDPDLIEIKKRQTRLENELKAAKEEAAKERRAGQEAKMRQSLTEQLATHGLDALRAKHAIGYLVDATKTVGIAETGEFVFRKADGEVVDLESGVKEWATSEDAKIYLPPRGTAGSGGANGNNRDRAPAPTDLRSQAADLLSKRLRGE